MSLNQLPFYCEIPDRFFMTIAGSDSTQFLQGLMTNDISTLQKHRALYTLMLTPQGRFWCDLFIYKLDEDCYLIEGAKEQFEVFFRKLSMYKLRSDIILTENENYSSGAILGLTPDNLTILNEESDLFLYPDPRTTELGYRYVYIQGKPESPKKKFQDQSIRKAPYAAYELLRISLGLPEGLKDMLPEKTFPLEANMDQWNAISFDKGCYVGQELTARTHHRGEIRKRYMTIRLAQETPWGSPISDGQGTEVGTLFSSQNNVGLARIKLEAVQDKLSCGGQDITILPPRDLQS